MVEFSIYMKPIPYFSLQVDFRLIITAHCKSLKSIMVINAYSLIRNLRKVAMYLNTSSTDMSVFISFINMSFVCIL